MKKTLAICLLILVLVQAAVPSGRALAVSGGQESGRIYPYAGLVTDFERTCSGVLIAPEVFLTAASCFEEDGHAVMVTLDGHIESPTKPELVSGLWIPHPDFCLDCPSGPRHTNGPDVAVVILDWAVYPESWAALPLLEDLEALEPGDPLVLAGYDVDQFQNTNGLLEADFTRYTAAARLLPPGPGQRDDYFRLSTRDAGKGTCFAEWGGPVLLDGTNVVAGVVSFGQGTNCRNFTYAYSLANQAARDFLFEALSDPQGLKTRHD
jgi:hypothetical protein